VHGRAETLELEDLLTPKTVCKFKLKLEMRSGPIRHDTTLVAIFNLNRFPCPSPSFVSLNAQGSEVSDIDIVVLMSPGGRKLGLYVKVLIVMSITMMIPNPDTPIAQCTSPTAYSYSF
jgi:hypothetical protein